MIAAAAAGSVSPKTKMIIITVVIVLIILAVVYFSGKKAGKGKAPEKVKIPAGVNIPTQWTPRPISAALYGAMKGAGTDEQGVWRALEDLNSAQLALVYNDFNTLLKEKGHDGETLFDWFNDELSGDDLARATQLFKGIV